MTRCADLVDELSPGLTGATIRASTANPGSSQATVFNISMNFLDGAISLGGIVGLRVDFFSASTAGYPVASSYFFYQAGSKVGLPWQHPAMYCYRQSDGRSLTCCHALSDADYTAVIVATFARLRSELVCTLQPCYDPKQLASQQQAAAEAAAEEAAQGPDANGTQGIIVLAPTMPLAAGTPEKLQAAGRRLLQAPQASASAIPHSQPKCKAHIEFFSFPLMLPMCIFKDSSRASDRPPKWRFCICH